jgi:hypothetical protein
MMNGFSLGRSLRAKLVAAFLSMAVIPLIAATLISAGNARRTLQTQLGDARSYVADQAALWLDRMLFERTLEVRALGDDAELAMAALGMADSDAVRTVLSNAANRSGISLGAIVYDLQGRDDTTVQTVTIGNPLDVLLTTPQSVQLEEEFEDLDKSDIRNILQVLILRGWIDRTLPTSEEPAYRLTEKGEEEVGLRIRRQ